MKTIRIKVTVPDDAQLDDVNLRVMEFVDVINDEFPQCTVLHWPGDQDAGEPPLGGEGKQHTF